MGRKIPSLITGMKVDRATFHNAPIEKLSFINFFYGNNGAGKSSIAYAIDEDEGLTWADGRSRDDYDVLVYNRDFVEENFSSYGDLKGVFIVNKVNKEVQAQIDAKNEEKKKLDGEFTATQDEWHKKSDAQNTLLTSFQNECWDKTVQLRADFADALEGKKTKKGFADAILGEAKTIEHDAEELKRLCKVAFDATSRTYPEFQRVGTKSTYGTLPGKDLLDKIIVSSAETDFAKFVRKIKASDWVLDGHKHYIPNEENKCPFCQQKMPDTFEEDIKKCFDEQYQQDVSDVLEFQSTYDSEMAAITRKLRGNLDDVMPSLDMMDEYKSKLELLESKVSINSGRLAEKAKEPSKVIALEDTDSLLLEIGELIDDINKKIKANNDVVNAKRTSKARCKKEVVELLAFLLKDTVKSYQDEKKTQAAAIKALEDKGRQLKKDIGTLTTDISKLNLQVVNTEAAITGINKILKDSGFQGFSLRAKPGVKNIYEVIRENGEVAENLSEGERNFIAFLYFYHLVRGSHSSDELKDKIVVIDDPVSSMDSTALFLVSSIVREMVNVCRNNTEYKNPKVPGDYIKQIFILTHNVYFHREITYQQVGYYDCTSFYIIRKSGNVSTVHLCEREKKEARTELENYNPVQNSYAALWDELRDADSVIPALNVMRRILEYYFLQLCGYEGSNLREELLEKEENKKKFIVEVPGSEPDMTKYQLASTMLAYINNPNGISDGLNFVEDFDDVNVYKDVFKLIFYTMGQDQHYEMMTGSLRKKD